MFGDTTITGLEQALNRSSLTQKVIAQNIANVDTPNYKAQEVTFNQALTNALSAKKTDPRDFSFSTGDQGRIVTDNSTTLQNNGNNVDIDKEMVNMAKNQLNYQAYTEAISRKLNQYNIVLGGSGA
ncbi:MAG TPA: flagellar basal body rod protein FlgB [Candidatus Angelobacter sp.]|nr:flagellar basal body rod protein FlgB [Candidatus Angelobacter sp.]